jgi:hypothetical protein
MTAEDQDTGLPHDGGPGARSEITAIATNQAANDQLTARTADLRVFIEACCPAPSAGKLFLPIGRGPHRTAAGKYEHRPFLGNVALNYPLDIDGKLDKLITESDTADVYMCPNLMYKDRTPGSCIGCMVAHADWDGDPDDTDAVLDKVRDINGFALASGTPGHIHAYVPLAKPVHSAEATRLCKAFQAYLPAGSDPGKHTVNDLLRPPGTYNHKSVAATGRPTLVQFLIRPGGIR